MKTHMMCKTPEYLAWANVIKRCYNPKHSAYHNYGGRGIGIAPEWRYDFAAFYKHIGPRPSDSHELDRIDNDKGYEPGNVRWVTCQQNVNNRRRTVYLEYKGKRYPLTELAKIACVLPDAFRSRIEAGWGVAEAVETPSGAIHCRDPKERSRKQTKVWVDTVSGRVSFSDACRANGVAIDTAWRRWRIYGWPLLQAVGQEPRK